MSLIHIDGITIPSEGDSVEEEEIEIADIWERTLSGQLNASMSISKRRWTFRTPIMTLDDAEKYKSWIEGRRQVWNNGGQRVSGAGVGNTIAGTLTVAAAPHLKEATTVGGGSQFGVEMINKLYKPQGWAPTDGWTIGFWSFRDIASDSVPSDGWHHYVASGAVTVTRGVSANPANVTQYRNGVAGSWNMGRMINILSSGNFCGWTGHTIGTNVGAPKDYEDGFFLPYQIPSTWLTELHTFMQTNLLGPAPFVRASGTLFPDVLPVPVQCRVKSMRQRVATLGGASASTNNNRKLEIVMEEA